eukprot:6609957-Prymnesium_polylepis.1
MRRRQRARRVRMVRMVRSARRPVTHTCTGRLRLRLRFNSTPTALPTSTRPHDHTGRVSAFGQRYSRSHTMRVIDRTRHPRPHAL